MRKLFFFRSAPTGENSNPETPSSISNKINDKVDNNSRRGKDLLSRSQKQFPGSQNSVTNTDSSGLTRSLSFSSAAFYSGDLGEKNLHCLNDPSRSPSTISDVPPQLFDYPVRCHSRTPEKLQSKAKRSEETTTRKAYGVEKPDSPGGYHDSSGNSSCSSDMLPVKCGSTHLNQTSNRILDLYIDGEQQQERNLKPKISSFQRNLPNNGNGGGWRRQVQSTAPASPTDSKGRARSYSFGEMREANVILLTRDRKRNEFEPEPPQKLAKNVVERLSKVFPQKPKTRSRRDLNPDTPTTIEDISEDYSDPHPHSNSNGVALKSCLSDGPYGTLNGCHGEDISGFQKHNCFLGDVPVALHSVQTEDDVDVELHRKAKEAEERVLFLSEELEQENFLQDNSGFSVSALLQMIRKLTEERRNLALEVSAQFQCQIAERASANEALKAAKVELDSQTWRLEKEKNEWQSRLEKELDKRSREWSFKLDKYQSEEQRSRERVRELAEQNICLQREVSSLNGRDTESRSRITYSDLQLKDLMARLEEAEGENQDLRKAFSELQGCFRAAEADWDCIQRAYKEKEKENKELQKALTRLQRTCSDQEKTIGGLRQGLVEEVERKQSFEKFDKLQMEQVRLTGVEQILRREMESYRLEVESLRRENINLLDRLGATGNDGGSLSFKLDQELLARVDCLQKQGLSLLNESSQLCIKLLESIKGKAGQIVEVEPHSKQGQEAQNGLDVYFVVESDMKVQSLKNGIENLTISLQTIASVVHEKSNPISSESQSQCKEGCGLGNGVALEDDIGFKLKAETLVTSVLREKLCSKELEIEQLQAEVATVVRGHDILRCEVQSAQDALSCVTHKMKELELQIMRKDESINKLKCDLQQCTKELTITRGILPKVSGERDLMWEEVKQYSEKNMLLNSEVNLLKKKIESLDEDVLLKEGQIQILKDSLSSKHFDILCSPKSMQEFMLK